MNKVTDWLLNGPPWVQYRTLVDLLDQPPDSQAVLTARKATLADPSLQKIIAELGATWPGTVLNSHKSASQQYHSLNFLVDIGFRLNDPGIDQIIAKIFEHQSAQGPFQLKVNISPHFGGSGQDTWGWSLCDAPLLLYALIRLGLKENPQVQTGVNFLLGLVRENGWPCAVSPELGKFRGPGRKEDPCPYANLIMLKMLAEFDQFKQCPQAQTGINVALSLWEQRSSQHPYLFYAGNDFCKLKAPLIWYDILHVADTLSLYPSATQDVRFLNMVEIIRQKVTPEGLFVPESIYTAWKNWDFGQKKLPSYWITFLAYRIFKRI